VVDAQTLRELGWAEDLIAEVIRTAVVIREGAAAAAVSPNATGLPSGVLVATSMFFAAQENAQGTDALRAVP
jgi:hypothetical protein